MCSIIKQFMYTNPLPFSPLPHLPTSSLLMLSIVYTTIPTSKHHPSIYAALKLNATSPVVAPPTHVLVNAPVGHVNCAALTQRSQRPLLMLIVAPAVVALRLKREVPEEPRME